VLAVSDAARRFHVAQGLPVDRVHVLYNGVDLSAFAPRPGRGWLHAELKLPRDRPLLGGIGQLGLRKAWDVAVAALATEPLRGSSAHLVIAGSQHSTKSETQAFVDALRPEALAPEIRGRVHLLGRREHIPQLLNELTILVHPARQEPLGRVLLEAAASGLPVVATDVGGTGEIFPARAKAAQLVQPDAPEEMAAAIAALLSNPERRRQLGAAARREMVQRFDVSRCVDALAQHYEAALKSPLGRPNATSPSSW
jgi:glycosyltransferase involved in cell wall biosynthesis